MPTSLRVLIADRPLTRFGVRLALDGYAEVCAEAQEGREAIRAALDTRPDVCLIGLSIPGGAIETVREIAASMPDCAVVVLADRDDNDGFLAALRAGAMGCVPAGSGAEELRRVISIVAAHEPALPGATVRVLLEHLRDSDRSADDGISERESEILALLREGQTTAAIADRLDISPITVRRHISKLVRKAGVADRRQLLMHGAGRRLRARAA